MGRPFRQVDVFTTVAHRGNPVAVVLDAQGLSDEQMQRFANWTNLSETTFVLPPTVPEADYRVRIFTPETELPFAGHPTLGTCHAWLEAGGVPRAAEEVVQECAVGPVRVRRTADGLALAAPPLVRSGPVEEPMVTRVAELLGLPRADILAAEWVDNGPGWWAVLLRDAEQVLALKPGDIGEKLGIVGPYPPGSPHDFEVRAFYPLGGGVTGEDPVTGSLNASLAQWLLRTGRAQAPYVASQGTALDRAGRVHISQDPDGTIWVGGGTITCITGEADL
jgi:PhzF family phenazine biosynthesis protein